jgi:hypothetical protein
VCAGCPQNQESNTTEWVYSKVAGGIKLLMEVRDEMKLSTTLDGDLQTCKACSCDLKLKVHAPMDHVLAHTSLETRGALDKNCWVLKAKV